LCPDTYTNSYGEPQSKPAVYLFLAYPRDSYTEAFVAYVGMATRLDKRLEGHEVLREVRKGFWVCRWFKPTKFPHLRDVERSYIQRFNPPWNLVGRTRGVGNA
jgi:hypothetical protein